MDAATRDLLCMLPGYDPFRGADSFRYDHDAAQHAVDFFRMCVTHIKGELAGKPYELRPHEECLTRLLYGWKRENGTRRYREGFYYVPRKNSKTTWLTGIGLYGLVADGTPSPEVYSAAASRDQASIVYRIMTGMVDNDRRSADPFLSKILRPLTASKIFECPRNGGLYRALAADAHRIHGENASMVLMDELHAQPNRDLYDALFTSQDSRPNPIFISTTTADEDNPESICNIQHDYACKVRDGIIDDPAFLPAIWEASIEDDWHDESLWCAVNPNLGHSIDIDKMRRKHAKAVSDPTFENTFKRLHLNIRTQQDVRWVPVEEWDACYRPDAESMPVAGAMCYLGVDLSEVEDLTALAAFFPESGIVKCWLWAPEQAGLQKDKRNRDLYLRFKREGLMEFSPGRTVQHGFIRRKINELCGIYNVPEIAVDPWHAKQFSLALQDEDGLPVAEFRQGYYSMNEPCKRLRSMILERDIAHDGNAAMRWMMSNVSVKTDPAGNIKLDKSNPVNKIDGVVAAVMAIGSWIANGCPKQSVYESRGVLTV